MASNKVIRVGLNEVEIKEHIDISESYNGFYSPSLKSSKYNGKVNRDF